MLPSARFQKFVRTALALVFINLLSLRVHGQTPSESRAFAAAKAEFEDGSYALSEKELGEFIRNYPASPRIPEAILYQARAAIDQQKFKTGVDLLSTNAALAAQF